MKFLRTLNVRGCLRDSDCAPYVVAARDPSSRRNPVSFGKRVNCASSSIPWSGSRAPVKQCRALCGPQNKFVCLTSCSTFLLPVSRSHGSTTSETPNEWRQLASAAPCRRQKTAKSLVCCIRPASIASAVSTISPMLVHTIVILELFGMPWMWRLMRASSCCPLEDSNAKA